MSRHPKHLIAVLGLVCLAGLAQACNLPGASGAPSPASGEEAESPSGQATPAPDPGDEADSLPAPTASPTPDLPPGWVAYNSPALGVRLALPPEWEPLLVNEGKLDLREREGDGWIEINVLDETSADEWNLEYVPGTGGDELLGRLLEAAREDGEYEPPRSLETRGGQTAWLAQGINAIYDEPLLIAVIGLPDRALLIIGHGGEDPDDWESRLAPLYETLVASLETGEVR
ncbi:MAG TPA: hypothetical protein ENI95_00845 [Chloroflexi bacterium]|nr:hypothetical protein [Chloroflexota bacterium]